MFLNLISFMIFWFTSNNIFYFKGLTWDKSHTLKPLEEADLVKTSEKYFCKEDKDL